MKMRFVEDNILMFLRMIVYTGLFTGFNRIKCETKAYVYGFHYKVSTNGFAIVYIYLFLS